MKILIRSLSIVKVLVILLVMLFMAKKVSGVTIIVERQIKSRYVKSSPTPTPTQKPASRVKIQAPRPIPVAGTVADKIRQVFGAAAETAIKVGFCESGLQPYNWNDKWLGVTLEQAIADKRAFGIFQIYLKAHPQHNPHDLLDADYNIREAYKLFQASGWGPWEASRHCWQTSNI